MNITPITTPLAGEQVVELSPSDAAEAAVTWLRRPNLFPGRALTAPTLDARSEWAAGHIVVRGQSFTPGIVNGLELGYTVSPASEPGTRSQVRLHIAAGRGLAASGEDVWLAQTIELDFYSLPVAAPPAVFGGTPGGADDDGGGSGSLRARAIGPSLEQLLGDNPAALPPAGVLVLQPAMLDTSDADPLDPCDRCGCAEGNVSYEDWRLADAVRLVWYAWPEEWRPLPAAGARFRNALAYTIFDAERSFDADEILPWEEFGGPIALIAVDADYVPVFSDCAAVARVGGRTRTSRLQLSGDGLSPRARLAPLAQAQIEQLAGQIADLGEPGPSVGVLAESFGRLPPFGILPVNVVDFAAHASAFFPGGFELDAVPVPLEQLDLAVREAAALAPLDLSLGERVRILVPVSQASWEPRLLLTETIDPLFQQTLDGYLLARSRALGARQGLKVAAAILRAAIDATPPAAPDIADDPDALEAERLTPWGPPPPAGGHRAISMPGVHGHLFDSATATLAPAAGDSLYAWVYLDPDDPPQALMLQWRSGESWEHRAYWGASVIEFGAEGTASRFHAGELPTPGQWLRVSIPAASVALEGQPISGMAFTLFDGRAAYGPSGRLSRDAENAWFANALAVGAVTRGDYPWEFLAPGRLWTPFEPAFGLIDIPGGNGPLATVSGVIQNLLTGGPLAALSAHERGQLTVRGLRGFIDYLTSRSDRADDVIDYGFLKIQTDVYRVRQLVLNTTAATRLAVSPTLAGIAQAETATASQEQISTFFDRLKASAPAALRESIASADVQPRAVGVSAALTGARTFDPGIVAGAGGAIGGIERRPIETAPAAPAPAVAFLLDTAITPIVGQKFHLPSDITGASPLVGRVAIRGLTIAERLAQPKAQEARDYASASRQEAVNRLLALSDTLRAEDSDNSGAPGESSGLFAGLEVFGIKDDPFLDDNPDARAIRRRPFTDFLNAATRANLLARLVQTPARDTDPDEGTHFSDATDTSDTSVALLRQLEGRVRLFRGAIAACRDVLTVLQGDHASALASESAWNQKLAEARHDVAVTRALIAEEAARLDAINERRAAVLRSEVRFLAYIRPRDADTLLAPPVRDIDPGLIDPPVPACLREHPDVPDELTDMLAVVREAPAAWFGQGATFFEGLNKVGVLVKAVQTTQVRAQLAALSAPAPRQVATGLAGAIASITARQSQVVSLARGNALQIDPVRLSNLTWQGAFQQAVQVVSLGDLISGEHGSSAAARRAADFYDRLAQVCACLHAAFTGVPPAIRLGWATQLSEFDTAPNLRNLASLPRWAELDYVDRRQMQAYADWLFSQASGSEPRAQALMNDVVRMCLLLASHAPVDRIIAGRLPRPVTVRPGVRIPLVALDPARVRLGMEAVVYRANQIVARAVVEDVGGAEVSARVLHTAAASIDLDVSARVQFAAPAAVSFAAAALRLLA